MADRHDDFTPALLAFVAGAVVGATAALLLTPMSGREARHKLAEFGEDSAAEVKRLAREAKFRLSPKAKVPDYRYDGGDAWV